MAPFKFIDLFCGVGGFRLGMERNGGVCVMSSEIDKFARQTYAANFGETPRGDVTQIRASSVPDHDVLCAGFPCQPFSTIGQREGFDATKGTLFYEIVRIAAAKQPAMLLLENVAGLLTIDKGRTFATILETLRDIGYTVFHDVLNSADFAVPQNRRRVFLLCFRNDIAPATFAFPEPTGGRVGIGDFLEHHETGYGVSKKIQDNWEATRTYGKLHVVDAISTEPTKTLCATYHKIQYLTSTFVADGDTGLRMLSKGECLALQGFPADFKVPVSRTQMYRQMGNSVTVPVIEVLAKRMLAAVEPHKRGREEAEWVDPAEERSAKRRIVEEYLSEL